MQDDTKVDQPVRDAISARLSLRPNLLEHVDGAWWPRSQRLAAELPALLATMSDRLGRVVMVGYRRDGWTDTPPQLDLGGHTVDLVGFSCPGDPCLILIGDQGDHTTLQVIAPAASEQVARQTLEAAQERPDNGVAERPPMPLAETAAEVGRKLARQEGRNDPQRTAEITRWCEQAAQEFIGARVQTFVPVLIEHMVRNRMMESRRADASP